MNHQVPWNFSATCENDETDPSRKYGLNSYHNFPHISSVTLTQPSTWSQIFASMDVSTSQVDDLHNTFGFLLEADQLNFQTSSLMQQANTSNIASQPEFSCESDKGQSSETKGRPDHEMVLQNCQSNVIDKSEELRSRQNDRRKRNRSAEVHKLCEKRRRNKINQRMEALQELIPNCNKSDRVSMLEDAINYVKALKLQVEMMSAEAGVVLQDQYTSPGGIQSPQESRFSPYLLPMRPNMSWCKCYFTGFDPMIPVPLASFHPLISAEGTVCLSLMSSGPRSHAIPQLRMQFSNSEQFPTSIDTSTIPTQPQDLLRDSLLVLRSASQAKESLVLDQCHKPKADDQSG